MYTILKKVLSKASKEGFDFNFSFEFEGAVDKHEGRPQLQSNCKSNAANYCSGIIAIGMRSIVGSTDRIGGSPATANVIAGQTGTRLKVSCGREPGRHRNAARDEDEGTVTKFAPSAAISE